LGASQLPSVPENLPLSTIPVYQNQVTNTVVQPDPLLEKLALSKASSNLDALLTNVKPVEHDNPWDWVPDQPLNQKNIFTNLSLTSSRVRYQYHEPSDLHILMN